MQVPEYPNLTPAVAFMAQCKDVGEWKPLNLKYCCVADDYSSSCYSQTEVASQ